MAQHHFEAHRLESLRARTRFASANAVLLIVFGVAVGSWYVSTHAATSTTADLDGVKIDTAGGGQYGGNTGGPYGGATVTMKNLATGLIRTSTANPFSFPAMNAASGGTSFIISVPSRVGDYVVHGSTWCRDACTGFNPQNTNFRAGNSQAWTIFPNSFYHIRWIYIYSPVASPPPPAPAPAPAPPPAPAPTPTPAPAPSPSPAPAPSPTPTPAPAPRPPSPTPAPAPGGVPAVKPPAASTAPAAAAPDTTAPTVPGHLSSRVGSASVALSWEASTDAGGAVRYQLERSLEQQTWQTLGDSLTEAGYDDNSVGFGTKYFYRLSALDAAGNRSAYATVEAVMPKFTSNAGSSAATFNSADEQVSLSLEQGALASEAICEITPVDTQGSAVRNWTKISGPYKSFCKVSTGEVVASYAKPAVITVKLSDDNLKNYSSFAVYVLSGDQWAKASSTVDKKAGTISFAVNGQAEFEILAAKSSNWWVYILLGLMAVGGLFGGAIWWRLRQVREWERQQALKRKYYEL